MNTATQSLVQPSAAVRWPSPAWAAATAPLKVHSWLWQRLAAPGRDACALYRMGDGGWRLAGTSLFLQGRHSCTLDYRLDTDARWRPRSARVQGRLPDRAVDLHLRADGQGGWHANGRVLQLPLPCVDLDFGFTPATHLPAIRRSRLAHGRQAQSPALWLDLPSGNLQPLVQCYQRTGPRSYAYAAPESGYSGTLTVDASGGIVLQPGLFQRLR